MRQIYTSPRQVNIDRVVVLLADHGIATTVTNRRAWQGHDWKGHSYSQREGSERWPQVWVVDANDQTAARELLREAGIEPATRYADELALERRDRSAGSPARHTSIASRARLAALAIVGIAALVLAMRGCGLMA